MPDAADPHPYDRHVGRYGTELARGLIAFAAAPTAARVLDVGCGTGRLTAELARVVNGTVVAVDTSAAALAVCRSRAPEADARIASAEELPFAAGEFDAALAQLVVNLVGDPAAAAEMTRVVRAGGVVAACCWDNAEMPLLRSLWDAVAAVAPEALADVPERTRVGFDDAEELQRLWTAAGLAEVTMSPIEVAADYESFDDLWAPFEAGAGRSGEIYRTLDPEQRAEVRARAHRAPGIPEGSFRLSAKAQAVRGVKA